LQRYNIYGPRDYNAWLAKPESVCVTNVEGSVIGELLRTVLCRR
jgi:hypothetical protein